MSLQDAGIFSKLRWLLIKTSEVLTHSFVIILLLLISFILCFYKLDNLQLEKWDESVNTSVVKETLTTKNQLILKYNKEPFFEKPPLWYYFSLINVKVIGYSNFTLRLVSAVSGFIIIILVYKLSKKISSHLGAVIAVLILLSTSHLFIFNPGGFFSTHNIRSADSDLLQILFMVISFYFFTYKKSFLGSIFTALAVLTKGPLGFLPQVVFLTRLKGETKLKKLKSIVLTLLLIAPWYIYMYFLFGADFLENHIGYHLWSRFTLPLENHQGGWHYYLNVLFNSKVFPTFPLLILALIVTVKRIKKLKGYKDYSLSVIILLIFLITTITQTKLAWYILPIYPFSAILIGDLYNKMYT